MSPEDMRAMFAAHALSGMLQGQITRTEIAHLAEGNMNGCPFVEAAWACADKMMEHVNVV